MALNLMYTAYKIVISPKLKSNKCSTVNHYQHGWNKGNTEISMLLGGA